MSEPSKSWTSGEVLNASDLNKNFTEALNDYRDFTYGETIAVRNALYLKNSDGRVYKASAATRDEKVFNFIGFAAENGVAGDVKKVQIAGKVTGFSFTLTETITETVDQIHNPGTDFSSVIYGNYIGRQQFITGNNVGNISKISLWLAKFGTPPNLVVEIYKTGENGNETGSALASISIPHTDIGTSESGIVKAISATLEPRQQYLIRLSITGLGGDVNNKYIWYGRATSSYYRGAAFMTGNNSWYFSSDYKFATYYTQKRYAYLGDNVYLQDTAGTIGLDEGTIRKKVGRIISPSEILIETQTDEIMIQKIEIGPPIFNGSNFVSYYCPAPRNARKVIISRHFVSSGYYSIAEMTLSKTEKTEGSLSDKTDSNNVGKISASWNGNEIRLTNFQEGQVSKLILYYFR